MPKSVYGILFLVFISSNACISTPAIYETPEAFESALKPITIEKFEIYSQDEPIFVNMDNLLTSIEDEQIFEQWNEMLGNCAPHRRNHPHYTDQYLIVAYHTDGHSLYQLSVDSNDDNKVDFIPLRTKEDLDFSVTYEMGLYRCEGLQSILSSILLSS
jgi:hypothetical protein